MNFIRCYAFACRIGCKQGYLFFLGLLFIFSSSCIVQSPKYTTMDKMMSIKIGMSKYEVEQILGTTPYNLNTRTDSSNEFIYVYRVVDRRTFSFRTKEVNGYDAIGKYMQMNMSYSLDGVLFHMHVCTLCEDNLVTTRKFNFGKLIVFMTVTLPVLLIYFGLQDL